MNRHRIGVWTVLAALAALTFSGTLRQCSTEDSVETLIEQSERPSYVLLDGRMYVRPIGYSPAGWAAKVRADTEILRQGGELAGGQYVCTTLEDCQALEPPGPIDVCTWCEHPQSPACSETHAAEVRAFCQEFDCDCE